MGVNKISLRIVQSAEKGLHIQSFAFPKLPKTSSDSCSRRASGKVQILFRSLNIPDIIRLATHSQVNSAAHRYFSARCSGHLWIRDIWEAYTLPVKILNYQQTCRSSANVMGLTWVSSGTRTFFIFAPRGSVLISSISPVSQLSVHRKATKWRICFQKLVRRLYFLGLFTVQQRRMISKRAGDVCEKTQDCI